MFELLPSTHKLMKNVNHAVLLLLNLLLALTIHTASGRA